jgi:hypothetical protein
MFVFVERTKSRVVFTGMAQFDTGLGDQVNDINFAFDFICGGHTAARIKGIRNIAATVKL